MPPRAANDGDNAVIAACVRRIDGKERVERARTLRLAQVGGRTARGDLTGSKIEGRTLGLERDRLDSDERRTGEGNGNGLLRGRVGDDADRAVRMVVCVRMVVRAGRDAREHQEQSDR